MPNPNTALLDELLGDNARLFVASNRGPITFECLPPSRIPEDLTASRGSGGLVTALAEVGRYAPITWVAAAASAGDRIATPELLRTHRTLKSIDQAERPLASRVRELVEENLPGQNLRL